MKELKNRPYTILSSAMTLDGKIATSTGSSEISSKEDLIRVHKLRLDVDAIMVGINTVLVDDPRLTVHKIDSDSSDNPLRIVVDSMAKIPLNSRILNHDAQTLIAVSNQASTEKIMKLKEKAIVFKEGDEKVDLVSLMKYLKKIGIKKLMIEGGSTLNFSMFSLGLIDEIRLCIAPKIVGGFDAKTLVDGNGIKSMLNSIPLKLTKSYSLGPDIILEYEVLND